MSDRLELARRRYRQILVAPVAAAGRAAELSLWLDRDVAAVVDELAGREDFRAQARWPAERLGAGAAGGERALVEAADAALIEWATRLAAAGRRPGAGGALRRLGPAGARGLAGAEHVAGRPWRDLVAVDDYFYPVAGLNLAGRPGAGAGEPAADFLPYFNPGLRRPGDYVSRALLLRVGHWRDVLRRCAARWRAAPPDGARDGGAAAAESGARLAGLYERLEEACLHGAAARLRGACVALVQVYADYRPRADLGWLGLPPDAARVRPAIRWRVERRHDADVGACVAAALADVAPLYRAGPDPAAVVAARCRSHRLVVVTGRGRREVHWAGRVVAADWFVHRAPWDLLAALVEGCLAGRGTDGFDVLPDGASGSLKDRRARLKRLIPAALDGVIRPAGRGTYRLALPPGEVCLLSYADDERLVEAPRAPAEDRRP